MLPVSRTRYSKFGLFPHDMKVIPFNDLHRTVAERFPFKVQIKDGARTCLDDMFQWCLDHVGYAMSVTAPFFDRESSQLCVRYANDGEWAFRGGAFWFRENASALALRMYFPDCVVFE